MLSLGDELTRVKLCNNALENLVDDGWEHSLVIVLTKPPVDCRKGLCGGTGQHAAGDVHHL